MAYSEREYMKLKNEFEKVKQFSHDADDMILRAVAEIFKQIYDKAKHGRKNLVISYTDFDELRKLWGLI